MEMAINNDLISRKALLEDMKAANDNMVYITKMQLYDNTINIIKAQPSAFDTIVEELRFEADKAWENTHNKFCNKDMAFARYEAFSDAIEIIYRERVKGLNEHN